MKIAILTFTKGINPGTFMQAYSVQYALKEIYPNANITFLDIIDFKKNALTKLPDRSLKTLFFQKLYAFIRLINYRKSYKKIFNLTNEKYDLFDYDQNQIKEQLEKFDLLVIGSDTILEQMYINGKIGLNYPSDKINIKKIYFSASASPANFIISDSLKEEVKLNLENFTFIGLRDELTMRLFTERIGINPELILKQPDPTFCLKNIDKFVLPKRYINKLKNRKKIALYNFNINFPYRKELATLLKDKGYTLISTFYNPYVDIPIATVDAFGWAGVFKYCDIVITERFHDTIFGLRNGKPVIAIDWDQERFSETKDSKTLKLLEDYDLKEFHFNLYNNSDLNPIAQIVDSLDSFEKQRILDKNEYFCNKAQSLLMLIKEKIIL